MVSIRQGDIWWVDFGEPAGSEPGYRRPAVVVQSDALNRSRIGTIICIPLSGNLIWADALGNVFLPAKETGLTKDSVANVSQIAAVDRSALSERVGALPEKSLEHLFAGIDLVLGR